MILSIIIDKNRIILSNIEDRKGELKVALSTIFNDFVFAEKRQIKYILLMILSLSGSAISALGDLCFSSIKRQCEVKDFGTIMPGHGGILDRFDSVIFTAPYVFLFIKTISIAI